MSKEYTGTWWNHQKREAGSSRGLSEGRVWEIRGSDILEANDKTGGAGSSQEVSPVSQQPLFTLQGIFLLPSEWEEQFGLRQPSQWLHLPMEQNLWGILSNSSNASGKLKGAHCRFLLLSWFFEGQFETAFDSRNSGTARGLNLCRGWRRWADPSLMSRNPSVTTHSFCQIPRRAMAAKDQQSSYQANVRSGMCLHPSWKPTGKKVPHPALLLTITKDKSDFIFLSLFTHPWERGIPWGSGRWNETRLPRA